MFKLENGMVLKEKWDRGMHVGEFEASTEEAIKALVLAVEELRDEVATLKRLAGLD